ncbi:hypothetical protein ACI1MP_03440 [Kitasatospora griseola]|uniref:hypothetical protein n=1 Tax=Kitasatospora griseola TaxID=2064 RepID=UPI003855EE6C
MTEQAGKADVRTEVPDGAAAAELADGLHGRRAFGLFGLAVLPAWRRRHVATRRSR